MSAPPNQRASVRIERLINAPPSRVYQAWLEPDLIRQWLAPGVDVSGVEVQTRVGGRYRVWHAASGENVGGFDCEILELAPDRRLVFRWGFAGPQRHADPVYDSLLTVTLRASSDNTTVLVLVHERLDPLWRDMPHVARGVDGGWNTVLTKLRHLVEK